MHQGGRLQGMIGALVVEQAVGHSVELLINQRGELIEGCRLSFRPSIQPDRDFPGGVHPALILSFAAICQ